MFRFTLLAAILAVVHSTTLLYPSSIARISLPYRSAYYPSSSFQYGSYYPSTGHYQYAYPTVAESYPHPYQLHFFPTVSRPYTRVLPFYARSFDGVSTAVPSVQPVVADRPVVPSSTPTVQSVPATGPIVPTGEPVVRAPTVSNVPVQPAVPTVEPVAQRIDVAPVTYGGVPVAPVQGQTEEAPKQRIIGYITAPVEEPQVPVVTANKVPVTHTTELVSKPEPKTVAQPSQPMPVSNQVASGGFTSSAFYETAPVGVLVPANSQPLVASDVKVNQPTHGQVFDPSQIITNNNRAPAPAAPVGIQFY